MTHGARIWELFHAKGSDSQQILSFYVDGQPIDWTQYNPATSVLVFSIHAKGSSTSLKTIGLEGSTFPTTDDGEATFTLSELDMSTVATGEYVWYVTAFLEAAAGKSPSFTGHTVLASGRFQLYAPDYETAYYVD